MHKDCGAKIQEPLTFRISGVLPQFYAAAPVGSPFRAALLTGNTNLRPGLPNPVPIPEGAEASGQFGLPTEEITMAEMLKENGCYTVLIGKRHLGIDGKIY